MRTLVVFLLVAAYVPTAAARKAPPPSKLTLVQAQCAGTPPGPCSPSFAFTSGTAILTGSKQPKPVCHEPQLPNGGEVRLAGVTKDGVAFSGTLSARVTLKTTFSTDTSNGNCELQGLQITIESLLGELACRGGKCKGPLHGLACLPGSCADTLFTTEFVSLVVQDDAGQPLATPGTFVAPARSDAP
jgi:hypothetical protein